MLYLCCTFFVYSSIQNLRHMATIAVVLRKKKKKDGTYPLALRITKNRKSSFIHLDYSIEEKYWDDENNQVRKSHPNSTRLNNYLIQKLAEASDTSLEIETQKKEVSPQTIKRKIKPHAGSSFAAQAELYLTRLENIGKYNRWNADKSRIKQFREFLPGGDIAFSEITVGLLNRFKDWLKINRKVGDRTIMNHLVVIRSVFSQAITDGATEEKYYPFGSGKIVIKFPPGTKVGLAQDEVQKLEDAELPEMLDDDARNAWLVSFYFAGMRVSDLLRLRWSDFLELRLHYTMGKNKKPGSLKTPQKALDILAKYEPYKRSDDDFIFPDLKKLSEEDLKDNFKVEKRIASATNRYDRILRERIAPTLGIKGKISMHISRHTFATLAGDKIPIQMLQKLYRHSTITTTVGYQANFIHKDADDALDAVLGQQ